MELPLDGPLQHWVNRGWVEMLPGCDPPIPPDLSFMEAIVSGFCRITDAGMRVIERRITELELESGVCRGSSLLS
jgi:hypothetical protein